MDEAATTSDAGTSAGPRAELLPATNEVLGLPKPDPGAAIHRDEEELFERFLDAWSMMPDGDALLRAARLTARGTPCRDGSTTSGSCSATVTPISQVRSVRCSGRRTSDSFEPRSGTEGRRVRREIAEDGARGVLDNLLILGPRHPRESWAC